MNDAAENTPPEQQPEPKKPEAPLPVSRSPGIGDRTPYDFEVPGLREGFWAPTTTNESYQDQFEHNLNIVPDSLTAFDKRLILRFVAINHSNAHWYWRAVAKERLYKIGFVFASLVAILALPLLLVYIPQLPGLGDKSNDITLVTAQITGLLTGLIAIQKTLAAWLGQRRVIGRFWRTRSALVDQIYNLEAEWSGRAVLDEEVFDDFDPDEDGRSRLSPGVRTELRGGIKEGRRIVREETEKFFDEYSTPDIQLGDALTSAQVKAATLFGAFAKPQLTSTTTRAEQRKVHENLERKARSDLEQAKHALEANRVKLAEVRDRLVILENKENREPAEDREKDNLIARETALFKAIAKGEDDVTAKEAALIAAQAGVG